MSRLRFRVPRWSSPALFIGGLALLVYVVSAYPFEETVRSCARMWPLVALTPAIALAWSTCSASALHILLERRVPWPHLLWIRLVGDSYNALLPLGGFGGEPFKVRQLCANVDPAIVMSALIRDRVVDNAMGFLTSAATIAIGLGRYARSGSLRVALVGYVVIASAIGLVGGALVLTRVPGRAGKWLARLLGHAAPEQIDRLPVGRLLHVAWWYLAARILGMVEIGFLLWILGLGPDLVSVAFVDGFLNAAGYVGFAIPGGYGVLEGASVYVLGALGAPGALAVAFAFARRGRMMAVGLFGVALHLGHLGARALAPDRWPECADVWNQRHRTAGWGERCSLRAQSRHQAVVGYVRSHHRPRVLDVGCGHGPLVPLLRTSPFATYLGTDISTEAVRRARRLESDDARFEIRSFEDPAPEGPFDVVIFDDSLAQAHRPVDVLTRHARKLGADGVLVVSMLRGRRNAIIWSALRHDFQTVKSQRVASSHGQVWTVSVLRPLAATRTSATSSAG